MKRHIASVESQVLGEWISWRNIAISLIDQVVISAREPCFETSFSQLAVNLQ